MAQPLVVDLNKHLLSAGWVTTWAWGFSSGLQADYFKPLSFTLLC